MERQLPNAGLEVISKSLYHQVEDVARTVHEENDKSQGHAKTEREHRKILDTNIKSGHDTHGRNSRDNPNRSSLDIDLFVGGQIVGNPSNTLKSGGNLDCTQTKRSTDTSDSHNNTETIDQITHPPPGVLSEDWVESRTERQRQLEAERSKRDADSNGQVYGPGM
mmetsp:Transcript_22704/g.41035  ORF Transcript_22704/g.41035 Transcript_22704/m.41035 type:complete len:165 (+) Transcript_22704:1651-2145(+)